MFDVHVHDVSARIRKGFPELGRTRAQMLARIVDPPPWTDTVMVFDQRTGRQLVVAFVNRPASAATGRVVLDLLVFPDAWRADLAHALQAAEQRRTVVVSAGRPRRGAVR